MSNTDYAVRVEKVSKVYRLWTQPKYRLIYALKKLLSPMRQIEMPNAYYDFNALHNASFEIRKGESWGFVGVNGSGKSTLLKMISGNLGLSSGRIEVDGKLVILDYSNGFNGEFTGKENIYLKAALFGLTKKQINERYQSIIDFAEIGDFINQPVKTYSSGMIARLGFAIIAHVDADIIITDEALAVGDVFFVQKCMKFIRTFLKNGTFLFVSHSTNDVLSLCHHAVWLDKGVIKDIGPASRVVQSYLNHIHLDSLKFRPMGEPDNQPLSLIKENIKSEVTLSQPALSKLMTYKLPQPQQYSRHIFNSIEVSSFNPVSSSGLGGVEVLNATLSGQSSTGIKNLTCGEVVKLTIEILAQRELRSPMVGFQVTDSKGQVVFADNSYLVTQAYPALVKCGTVFLAEFTYQMPVLSVGQYGIRVAVAIGEEEGDAMMLQMIDKALTLRTTSSSSTQGLIGLPMQTVTFAIHGNSVVNRPGLAAHAALQAGATSG